MGKNVSLLIRRKDTSPIEFIREDVAEIIAYWNASPGLPHHKAPTNGKGHVNTKVLSKIVKDIGEVLDGKFQNEWPPYSKGDIIKAIDGFRTRLTNSDYVPSDKTKLKSINLSNFFLRPFTDSYIWSMFLECLNNPPKLVRDTVPKKKEKNPALTKWLQELYIDKILLGHPKTFDQVEVNKFIKGANLLFDSIPNLRKRANLITGPREFCEYVVEALIKNWGREEVGIGHFGSEWTYHDLLPRYLKYLKGK